MVHQRHYSVGGAPYDTSAPLPPPSHLSTRPSRVPPPHPHNPHPYPHPPIPPSQCKSPSSTAQGSHGQTASPALEQPTGPVTRRVGAKANVSSACGPCKRAHVACDVGRPCKRCINRGNEDHCEDLPHKKRGRPKAVKPAFGQPYSRVLPPVEDPSFGKWRDAPPSGYPPLDPTASLPAPRAVDPELTYTSSAPLFTLFTTTELKVLRVSPGCYALTGYHPHEYVNSSLFDWLHPSDRHLIEMERVRLITVPFLPAPLQSDRNTQALITHRSERELLSPADGMREPYPNQNVRVVQSDNHFRLFNVRLHLGGGLGASLWRGKTLGRIYLVVSLLLITTRTDTLPLDFTARRPSPLLPPAPMSSAPAQAAAQGLPSFSSPAAAAGAPTRYDTPPVPPPSYYSVPPARPPPLPSTTPAYSNYPRNASANAAYLPPPRSPPPPAAYRPTPAYLVEYTTSGQPQVQPHPQPPSQGYYGPRTAPPPPAPSRADPYRHQVVAEDEWGRRTPSNEYGRRAWER